MAGHDLFAAFLNGVSPGLIQRIDGIQIGLDHRLIQLEKSHFAGDNFNLFVIQPTVNESQSGVDAMSPSGKTNQHRPGLVEITRFVENPPIEEDRRVRSEDITFRKPVGNPSGLRPGIEAHQGPRIVRRFIILLDLRRDDLEPDPQRPEEFAATR